MFMFKDLFANELNCADTEFTSVFFRCTIEVRTH